MEYYIKQREWEIIFKTLLGIKGIHSRDEGRLRRFAEGVWYVCRTGCQWRLLPAYYGNWRSIHMRFLYWSRKGIWEVLFKSMQEADMESVMIDATIVRAHACSAGYEKDSGEREGLGRSKGGFSTKIHALVDALGNPLKFILSLGQRHDITEAEALLYEVQNTTAIADKGYDSEVLVKFIEDKNSKAVIPPRKNRKAPREYEAHLYKERHLIECFFGKIKHFRRVFSRFDKTAKAFINFLNFAGIFIWLR